MSSTGLLFALAASLSWGVLYVVDQRLLNQTTATGLFLLQSLVAIAGLSAFRLLTGQRVFDLAPILRQPGLFTITLVLTALANVFILASIKHLNASLASVIEITYPLFIVLVSWLMFRTVPSGWFAFGASLIFVGSAIILIHR